MNNDEIRLYGQTTTERTAEELASVMRGAGLDIQVTSYGEIKGRDGNGSRFLIYPADPGEYLISIDADTPAAMRAMAERLSSMLAGAGLRHRIEIYSEAGALVGYLHHSWPLSDGS